MKCPIDNTDLKTAEREGVKIDYCPTCKGVWLDRGELDKIIERSVMLKEGILEKEKHPGYPDLMSKSQKEGSHYKSPGDSYFGSLFEF